jgi:hypothetical protein
VTDLVRQFLLSAAYEAWGRLNSEYYAIMRTPYYHRTGEQRVRLLAIESFIMVVYDALPTLEPW